MAIRRRGGPSVGLALLALLAAPALPGAVGRVLAHAQLVASAPGAGDRLEEAPAELRLVFSEPLESQATSVDLADADGTVLLERGGEIDPADPFTLVVSGDELPELADGVYTVTWRTLSAADGHPAEGFFSFAVGTDAALPSTPGGMTHTDAEPIDLAARWLTYLGLLLAVGVPLGVAVVLRMPMAEDTARALSTGLLVAGGATLALAVVNGLEAGSVGEYLLASRNGLLQLSRGIVALAGGAVLLLGRGGRSGSCVAVLTGLVGIVLLAAASHASALPGPVPIVVQAAHAASAGVWAGGVALLLALFVRPRLLVGRDALPPMRALVPRFSALALVSIGLIGLTGVFTAWSQTGVLIDPGSDYGRTLLLKTALASGAIGLGGLNFLDGGRLRAWLGGMRTRLTAEVALIGSVLLMTGVLATTPPVDEPTGVAIAPVPDAFGQTAPGMSLTLAPGRPGVNRAVVTTTDAMAMISGGLELVLEQLDTGTTTRVPLRLAPDAAMDHSGMEGEREVRGSDSPVEWVADAVVLPPGSRWDATVRIVSVTEGELARQRFAFSMSATGVEDGQVTTILNLGTVVGGILLIGGALALGVGLGGGRLPRCDAAASRIALIGGGTVAVCLGLVIGIQQLAAL